jgi:glycosyltransferase involved in cell wall biosynthesis
MVVLFVRDLTGGIRKHVVSIISSYRSHPDEILLVTNLSQADSMFREYLSVEPWLHARILDVKIRRSPSPLDLLQVVQVAGLLRKQRRPMVFHGHGAKGGMLARIVGKLLGAKVIYTPHGGSLHAMYSPLGNTVYAWIESVLARMTDLFVFESKYSQDRFFSMVAAPQVKTVVNSNGIAISPRVSPKPLHESRVRIGAFGALRFIKGYDVLIQAIGILKQRGLHVEASIYGAGEERENLLSLARQLNVETQVRLPGETASPLKAMQDLDIVVQPSRFESFGYTALEAMTVGVPVIASCVGGLVEVVEDGVTGLTFESEDAVGLASGIQKLINDMSLRTKLVQNAYETARTKFSEERMVATFKSLYKELSSDQTPSAR